ncbi:hypothetical protein [Pseudalkalibacillus salsuginis]|uniref:hypothetical protein n=1 Tax=Pseudalkalibacillus salsuginis TaxID=2910972 RepID=UPI001F1CC761|nr:hypothetical protein [Pseudalkalibacillus salsuginis]MCF6411637.1 hypothetical protein [Pseudalkalibacillus salsuginis]
MEIRLGVIGPEDSVRHILNSAEPFADLTLLPFPYTSIEQVDEIIQQNRDLIDQWFFSGQVPYAYALSKGLIQEKDGIYPPLFGASLLGKVLEAFMDSEGVVQKISLDTIQEQELHTTKQYFSLQKLQIFPYSYPDFRPMDEIVDFHRSLFEKGKTEIAFTCIRAVYLKLKELGIPCYRITPSHLSIYFTLRLLKERGVSSWYQRSQLALLGVELLPPDEEGDEHLFSYDLKHKELSLKRLLLELAERINGSFVQIGDGLYYIYTTRGEIEFKLDKSDLFHLIETVYSHSRYHARIGIGYGLNALQAEENVRTAFRYARKTSSKVVLVDEKKKVTEYLTEGKALQYDYKKWIEGEWSEALRKANISPTALAKIESLAKFYKKEEVNSQEVARWLGSSERNARRILSELESLNLATSKSVQLSGSKGRPRKVYRLILNNPTTKKKP